MSVEASAEFIATAREVGQWIPAVDFLPPSFIEVLACVAAEDDVWIAYVDEDRNWRCEVQGLMPDGFFTHWRPLPCPPAAPASKAPEEVPA